MKRRSAPSPGPAQCESCAADIPPNGGLKFEGYLVCIKCRSTKAAKLLERRRREDEEIRERLGR
jgi:hypothetical protein